ncbi:long-chain-fatty-acid-CoA ligase [Geomicrobium sp. JCM 19037]|uniref:AMP-binding enzyme n=1 Tax=Geomicrobium sp. JCM 19037 TaxID=1460634 RepID=UPI00045F2FA8|nr:hypothetical protein [Geomicrobium sp. JCM 19037]GAK03068.1 long-chain-fatty-acid-CoA ligase [Geomicrobium sp. JCM 19037]
MKAFVVKDKDALLREEDIESYCKEKLASYKVPKAIEFLEELPKTAVGKILKRELVRTEKTK